MENSSQMRNDASTATVERRHWTGVLRRRWPAALAVACAALIVGGGASDDDVAGLGEVLLLLPLLYLIVAKIRRPRAAWPVLVASFAAIVALRLLDVVTPTVVFVVVALLVLVWGGLDGQLHRSGMFRVQALGMVGFGALALVGLAVDPELARFLVAAGWLCHGVWDLVHFRLGKVVARSYAEWCGVVDILVAVQLVLLV